MCNQMLFSSSSSLLAPSSGQTCNGEVGVVSYIPLLALFLIPPCHVEPPELGQGEQGRKKRDQSLYLAGTICSFPLAAMAPIMSSTPSEASSRHQGTNGQASLAFSNCTPLVWMHQDGLMSLSGSAKDWTLQLPILQASRLG